jgi:hypothetical protein
MATGQIMPTNPAAAVRGPRHIVHHLTHRRTASFRLAAACTEATTSLVNLIAIMAGLRDP